MTNRRVVFLPRWWERLLRARPWELPVDDVSAVTVASPDVHRVLSGGRRPRLRLELTDGTHVDLVVWRPERSAVDVAAALGRRPCETPLSRWNRTSSLAPWSGRRHVLTLVGFLVTAVLLIRVTLLQAWVRTAYLALVLVWLGVTLMLHAREHAQR